MNSSIAIGINAANRLDRLPVSSIHKKVMIALAIAYFFEYGDLNTFTYVAPALINHWHVSVKTVAFITSSSFLGMFLGGMFGGWIADKIGRKKAIIYSVICLSLFSLLNAFAWDPVSFGVIRFITGMGTTALLINANTYLSEFFPTKVRGKYQAIGMAIGVCGIPITGWVSSYLIPLSDWGWRTVFIWGAFGIFSLFFISRLEEIPRWYEARGQFDKAEEILQRIEEAVRKEKGTLPNATSVVPQTKKYKIRLASISQLFKGHYLKRTSLLTAAWVFQTIGLYGFGSWVPTLLVKQGFKMSDSLLYTTLITLGAPLGALVGALISDRLERKTNVVVSSALIAVAVFLYGVTLQPVFIITFGFLINLIERTYASNLYTYTSELYPTETRALGQGLTYGIGRFSNMFGPLIISAIYTGNGYMKVFVFIAACWLASAIVLCFGPRTSNRSLEELNTFNQHPSTTIKESNTVNRL